MRDQYDTGMTQAQLWIYCSGRIVALSSDTPVALEHDFEIETDDVHAVAGLMKAFFDALPIPLLTFELYSSFIAVPGTRLPGHIGRCMIMVITILIRFNRPGKQPRSYCTGEGITGKAPRHTCCGARGVAAPVRRYSR